MNPSRTTAWRMRAAGVFAPAALMILAVTAALAQTLTPSVDQIAQQLAVTPQQLDQFRNRAAAGNLSADQMQELCARIAAKHLSPSDIQAMAASMGLRPEETAQLSQCSAMGRAGGGAQEPGALPQGGPMSGPASLKGSEAKGSEPAAASAIEARYHALGNPFKSPANPSPEKLEQFGYSAFSAPVSTFAPGGHAPVSGDYMLGPGDSLTILLWGRINQTLDLPVQRDGAVLMPNIGPIQIAGLEFDQAKQLIESRAGQIEGVHVSVTMGQIRTIQVFVLGQVKQPGLYTVSALSHVSNAIVAAGGLSKVGSLRNVELRRGNRTVRVIDLYDLLLRGDASGDARLEARDVIFVPVIGPVVGITGDVKSPAIYELKGGADLRSVLRLAGGVSAFGYGQRLQVERIENHQRQIALDISLGALGGQRFTVRDGDLLKIFPVLPMRRNIVTLNGNANRPGAYQWHDGMRVADLIREGEGIADHTYLDYASIKRRVGPAQEFRYLPVDLRAALEEQGQSNLVLQPRDELTLYSDTDMRDVPTATVRGAVRKPGTYPLTTGMRVSDLIAQAGGLKDNAYKKNATLARTQVVGGANTRHIFQDVNLVAALAPDSASDPPLMRGDEIFVQVASNWRRPGEIKVSGEVLRPGPYAIREGERLLTVLEESGGLRPGAYLAATVFIRESVRIEQQKRIEESKARLQSDIARISLMPRQAGSREGDQTAALAQMQKVLAATEGQQAVGRIALNIKSLGELASSPSNITLEDADTVTIPKRPASVSVLGQVYSPAAIVYEPDFKVRDYLQRAGGPSEGADEDHIFVIKASGAIMTGQSYRDMRRAQIFPLLPLVSGGLMDAYLQPGDTIYVPVQLIQVTGLQYATDMSQIIANSALALGTLGLLATR